MNLTWTSDRPARTWLITMPRYHREKRKEGVEINKRSWALKGGGRGTHDDTTRHVQKGNRGKLRTTSGSKQKGESPTSATEQNKQYRRTPRSSRTINRTIRKKEKNTTNNTSQRNTVSTLTKVSLFSFPPGAKPFAHDATAQTVQEQP